MNKFLLALMLVSNSAGVAAFASAAQEQEPPAAQPHVKNGLGKIRDAASVTIDCSACPRALAKAGTMADEVLKDWNRFRIEQNPKRADLVFLFAANPYRGDYVTRESPDKRPVRIETITMTVIDPHTEAELWSDSRQWGSFRVAGATKSLIDELRQDLEAEAKQWSLDDVFACAGNPAYERLALDSPEAALTQHVVSVTRMAGVPDRLVAGASNVPMFCTRVELLIGRDGRIMAFEVVATSSDILDVNDVLERADQFEFTSGKDSASHRPFLTARTKDGKIGIEFLGRGHQMVLSHVTYFF